MQHKQHFHTVSTMCFKFVLLENRKEEWTIHFPHPLDLSCNGQVAASYDYSSIKWKHIIQTLNCNFLFLTLHFVMDENSSERSKVNVAPNKGKSLSFHRKLPRSTASLMNTKQEILPLRTSTESLCVKHKINGI